MLVNGTIFTADPKHTYAAAIAIKGERIPAVGPPEEISRLVSPHTNRIDLQGRLVIPGINDAHYHFLPRPVAYQLLLKGQEPTWGEVKKQIAAEVANTPPGTLINGVIGLAMFDEPEANRDIILRAEQFANILRSSALKRSRSGGRRRRREGTALSMGSDIGNSSEIL